jgi:4-hydroxyacetophenone monooxygenase
MAPASTTEWSDAELRAAVEVANVPVLLVLLVHMTGDRRWLEEPYRPKRNNGLGDNPTGGLPDEVQREVRDAAFEAIRRWRAGAPLAIPADAAQDTDLLVELLSFAMGEEVPAEYAPMIAEDLAMEDHLELRELAGGPPPPPGFNVVVIGAGLSGVAAGVALQEAGIPYTIIERNAEVGGTWLDNRYPGCGVDTPSAVYSYAFSASDWSQYFAGRDEVLDYVQSVARAAGVHRHIQFRHEVLSAAYHEHEQRWSLEVRTPAGVTETLSASVVLTAAGAFTRPKMPSIPGLDRFAGPCVHTARWPEDLELEGRRVGVIGNGASAMQVVPAIADRVAELTVFQRSPQWVAPFPYLQTGVSEPLRRLAQEVPLYRKWSRLRWAWTFSDRLHGALQKDPEWPHPERSVNALNDGQRRHMTRYLDSEIGDRPDLREALLPDYPPFGKRILLDNGWYRTLIRDHVRLVTDPIAEATSTGLVTDRGEHHELDVLICATGFDVVQFLTPIEISGRSGRNLHEFWGPDDAKAYLGTAIPGFPNLFMLFGPNLQPGHGGSVIGIVEMQVRYVIGLLQRMFRDGLGAIECREEPWADYNRRVDEAHEDMIWTHPGMSTYYRNPQGRVVVPGPFRVIDLWHMLSNVDLGDYETEPLARVDGLTDTVVA